MEPFKYSFHPRTAFLEILYGCNLYCTYCYIGRVQNHIKPQVPPREITRQILNILKRENIEEVVLLGGEPLLHPHLAEICHAIAELDFPHRGIVTNGTVLTQEKAKLLMKTGFWVDISFRGPDTDTFDNITGKRGSFKKAFDAALLLSSLGMPVGIEFDCIPQNYHRLYETIKKLFEAGVRIKQLQLHRIMPEGDAKHNLEKISLTLDQWHTVFDQAARIRDELDVNVVFEDGFPLCLVGSEYWNMITPCPCGFTLLTVGPAGDIRYCSCYEEVLGNVLQKPLKEIWEQSLQDFQSPSRHHFACLKCDLFESCRGGCSASGRSRMNKGMDIFNEHFHSVKLDTSLRPETKLIIGQGICNYDTHQANREHLTAAECIEGN